MHLVPARLQVFVPEEDRPTITVQRTSRSRKKAVKTS
jgi:hypothetical protein